MGEWEEGQQGFYSHTQAHSSLAEILNPLQWFMEGSVPPIKGFFPQDLHTTPPVKPSSPVALI